MRFARMCLNLCKFITSVVLQVTEYLFKSRNDFGMDIAAIDIQRSRNHGVPGYNAHKKICRLEPVKNFDDLSKEMSLDESSMKFLMRKKIV